MIEEELTPPSLRCTCGYCVSVYRLKDGQLLVIGKKPNAALAGEIHGKVGPDEEAVVIAPEFFSNLPPAQAL